MIITPVDIQRYFEVIVYNFKHFCKKMFSSNSFFKRKTSNRKQYTIFHNIAFIIHNRRVWFKSNMAVENNVINCIYTIVLINTFIFIMLANCTNDIILNKTYKFVIVILLKHKLSTVKQHE